MIKVNKVQVSPRGSVILNFPFLPGVKQLFDTLIAAIISRKDQIERENEEKKRDSVFLTQVTKPAWSAQADEEEKKQAAAGNGWSCCQL